jgi:hypothetical protein
MFTAKWLTHSSKLFECNIRIWTHILLMKTLCLSSNMTYILHTGTEMYLLFAQDTVTLVLSQTCQKRAFFKFSMDSHNWIIHMQIIVHITSVLKISSYYIQVFVYWHIKWQSHQKYILQDISQTWHNASFSPSIGAWRRNLMLSQQIWSLFPNCSRYGSTPCSA